MPRAGFKHAPGIDVELERPDSIFLPGEIINGNVIVNSVAGLSGGQNNVHINFYGRSKVLIVRNTGEGKDYYRGRAILFQQKFFLEGPPVSTSEATGRETWSFSIQIPTHTVPGQYKSNDTWKKASKYLDNVEMDISQHPLPGVFYYCGDSGGTRGQCYVEYVLEVSLRPKREIQEPNKKQKKEPDVPTTIIPLVIRTRSSERPINYSEHIQDATEEVGIKSLRLLPHFATEQKLGIKNNFKSVFRPSKIPHYFFDLKIACPSTIQLDNPSYFPFRLSVIPKSDSSGKKSDLWSIFDGCDTSKLPDVKISEFSLCLKMWSMMRARSVWKWDTSTEKHHEFAISPDLPPHMVGYVIPRENGTDAPGYRHPDESNISSFSGNEQYLDLGQLLNLRLSRTHSTRLEGERNDFKAKRPLWSSFKTYNINLHYEWKYKITIMCAGETEVIEGKQKVELIAQSEEQEQDINFDKQGVRKKWGELLEGAEGVVEILGAVGEIVAEAASEA